jgi:phage terminase large subunit-like protein
MTTAERDHNPTSAEQSSARPGRGLNEETLSPVSTRLDPDQTPAAAWDLSCVDWEARIRAGRSLVPTLPLDKRESARAIAIFNKLRLPDVPGKPRLADAAGNWFKEIIAALFGSIQAATQERAIRELFIMAPKKSSKTSYGAALMLTALLMNKRPRAEFLLIAPTKQIADLGFAQAVGMIQADPYLQQSMHIQEHLKTITDNRREKDGGTESLLRIKTFGTNVLTGVKPAGVLIDELHEIAKDPDAARVIGQLRGGLLPNPEAFLLFITTQADVAPSGAFRTELLAARMIRDGKRVGATLPILFEFPLDIIESGEWRDPANWWMVTPNRDRSVTIARLIDDFSKAQLGGEVEVRRWSAQHLNVEVGLALHSNTWSCAEDWESCGEPGLTLDALIERSEVIVIGIDGGGRDDLLAISIVGREAATKRWLHWGHAWAHEIVFERRKSEAARLHDFVRDGDLTIVTRPGQDIVEVGDLVQRIEQSGKMSEKAAIGVDRVGIGQIVDEIARREIDVSRIFGVAQGWQLSGAILTTERKVGEKAFAHGASPLMAWSVGNAKVEPKGNAISITKQASGRGKIDPLMALFNAVALMSMNPEAGGSVYSADRGLLILSI